jgi:hypothetical protein
MLGFECLDIPFAFEERVSLKVSPLLLNVIPASAKEAETYFSIEISTEALWAWRNITCHDFFISLNDSLQPMGYRMSSSIEFKVGNHLRALTHWFVQKVRAFSTHKRKDALSKNWFSIKQLDKEMVSVPSDVIEQREAEITRIEKEIQELNNKLDEKNEIVVELLEEGLKKAKLLKEMENVNTLHKQTTNKGKTIQGVQHRQQRRKLNEVRYFKY